MDNHYRKQRPNMSSATGSRPRISTFSFYGNKILTSGEGLELAVVEYIGWYNSARLREPRLHPAH